VHGKGSDKYDNVRIGMNSRLDTIQAAILIEKLAVFPEELANRRIVAAKYEEGLSGEFRTPTVPNGYDSSWAQYAVLDKNRDEMIAQLKNKGIPSVVYYGTCMHQQTAFNNLKYQKESFRNAKMLSEGVFCLPMHPYLDKADQMKIVTGVLNK